MRTRLAHQLEVANTTAAPKVARGPSPILERASCSIRAMAVVQEAKLIRNQRRNWRKRAFQISKMLFRIRIRKAWVSRWAWKITSLSSKMTIILPSQKIYEIKAQIYCRIPMCKVQMISRMWTFSSWNLSLVIWVRVQIRLHHQRKNRFSWLKVPRAQKREHRIK